MGQGQLSLAKFLLIVNRFDDEQLDIHDVPAFLQHVRRVDGRLQPREQRLQRLGVIPEVGAVLAPVARRFVGLPGIEQRFEVLVVRRADVGERR